jgi:protoporphyrinogen oxidase
MPSEQTTAPDDGSSVPVAVLGAGLTGMSAAHHLRAANHRCRIFEKLAWPGGHAVTIEEQGYRFDRTGHLLHMQDDAMRDLALGWIGPDHSWLERRSVVWSQGVYTRYPFQANAHGLPPAVAHACVMGFLEARANPPATPPSNFEEYCYATFGKGISEHFMIPYNARLWGVSPKEISASWCERFVPVPTVDDVVAGAVGLVDRELGYNKRFIYPNRGIGQLSDGMAAALGDVELSRSVRHIDTAARQLVFDDETVRYQVLVNSAPLPTLVGLCRDAPDEVVQAAARLRCSHLYYLDVALKRPCGQPYHWVYVPESKYPYYRVGCYSHFSREMAPQNTSCLYVELVDRAEPDLDRLLPQVAAGLVEMGMIDAAEDIAFVRVRRIDHAYVIFDHAYDASRELVQRFLATRNIVSSGRYGAWNYSSMGDAMRFGRDAATRAGELLQEMP